MCAIGLQGAGGEARENYRGDGGGEYGERKIIEVLSPVQARQGAGFHGIADEVAEEGEVSAGSARGEKEGDAFVGHGGDLQDAGAEGDGAGEAEHLADLRGEQMHDGMEAEAGAEEGGDEKRDLQKAGEENAAGEPVDALGAAMLRLERSKIFSAAETIAMISRTFETIGTAAAAPKR